MELYRSCQVLLLGAVLSSAACVGQTTPAQSELTVPSTATASGNAVMDTAYCPAISASDSHLALVSKFCEFARTYRHMLPDFIAQQTTSARQGSSTNIVTAQVTFQRGQEHYSHVTINGRAAPSNSLTSTPPKNIQLSSNRRVWIAAGGSLHLTRRGRIQVSGAI